MTPEQPPSPDAALNQPAGPSGEPEAGNLGPSESPPGRAPGKTRKERLHGKSKERVLQDLTDDRTIDEAIRESIRLHGA